MKAVLTSYYFHAVLNKPIVIQETSQTPNIRAALTLYPFFKAKPLTFRSLTAFILTLHPSCLQFPAHQTNASDLSRGKNPSNYNAGNQTCGIVKKKKKKSAEKQKQRKSLFDINSEKPQVELRIKILCRY